MTTIAEPQAREGIHFSARLCGLVANIDEHEDGGIHVTLVIDRTVVDRLKAKARRS